MEEKKEFLLALIKEYYTQGDSYFASLSKKGTWNFGYSNDYPLQHGSGQSFNLPDKMVTLLMLKEK